MRTIFRFYSLLLCLVVMSCKSSTPTPTQIIAPTLPILLLTQTIIPTETQQPTQNVTPTATISSTQTVSSTVNILSPYEVISLENAANLVQREYRQENGEFADISQTIQNQHVSSVAFSPDGEILATASEENGQVNLYSISTGELTGVLEAPANRIVRITFSPNGKLLAVAYDQFVPPEIIGVQLWDVATQTSLLIINDFTITDDPNNWNWPVYGIDFNPDGTILATGGGNPWGFGQCFVKLWDVESGDLVWETSCIHTAYNITFNPDGKLIATANGDGNVHYYETTGYKEISAFEGVRGYAYGIAFSPDGKLIAISGDANRTDTTADLRLWDLSTGDLLYSLEGHSTAIRWVVFSPSGQVIASASSDSVRLWDVQSGNSLAVLDVPTTGDVAFSPDGTLLATSGDKLRLWGVPGD